MTVKDKPKPSPDQDMAKRLAGLVAGRTITRVKRADAQEIALELDDGSRIFVRTGAGGLDISVT